MIRYFFFAVALLPFFSCSKKIVAEKPLLATARFNLDSLPTSEINIPVSINLKPIFSMAESQVDTLFTSPDYPRGWVQQGCDTRYQYRFRRGPLEIHATGNRIDLGFTGYYRISGSTRVCLAGTALSSWSSPCRCGFDEPERRVKVSFSNWFALLPDYRVQLRVQRNQPQALDKCEVCFWGQDITSQVISGLSTELDATAAQLQREYGTVNLRTQFQNVWNSISKAFDLYGQGWLQINPRELQINQLTASNDSLYINLGLLAKPVVRFEKPVETISSMPNLGIRKKANGFNIFVDAVLNYDSLSRIVNAQMAGQSFDFKKGPVNKKFVVRQCELYGSGNERLIIKVDFAGSNQGTVYLTGKPHYDAAKKMLEIRDMEFDIRTRNLLLGTADWLFNRRIIQEISQKTRFDLSQYIDSAKTNINQQMNREWYPGTFSSGAVDDISIIGIFPLPEGLHIRSNVNGQLSVRLDNVQFSL